MTPTDAEVAAMVARIDPLYRDMCSAASEARDPNDWSNGDPAYDDFAEAAANAWPQIRTALTRLATPAADSGVREALRELVACKDASRTWVYAYEEGWRRYDAAWDAARAVLAGTTTQPAATPSHFANGPSQAGADGSAADPDHIGEVVVTKNVRGQIVAVTRQDSEGRILSVIAKSTIKEAGSVEGHARAMNSDDGTGGVTSRLSESRPPLAEAASLCRPAPAGIESGPASPQDDALIARLYQFAVAVDASRAGLLDWSSADCAKLIDALETAAARLSGAKAKGSDGETYAANL